MNENERRCMTDAKEREGYPVNVSEAPMRVAVYLRVATMGQVPIRTEDLIRSYVDKIQREKNWSFAGAFIDDSGQKRDRQEHTDLGKVIQMCEAQEIDIILTRSTTCFSRYTGELIGMTERIRALGVTVIFERDQISSEDPEFARMLVHYDNIAKAARSLL